MNNLAFVHDGLRIIIFVGQACSEYKEHYQSESQRHKTGLIVVQDIDLDDVKCRECSDDHCRNRQAHSDDCEDAHLAAIHKFLVAVGNDLFLEHLLQAVAGQRRNRCCEDRLLRCNPLRCFACTVRALAFALSGKFGSALLGSRSRGSDSCCRFRRFPGDGFRGFRGFLCRFTHGAPKVFRLLRFRSHRLFNVLCGFLDFGLSRLGKCFRLRYIQNSLNGARFLSRFQCRCLFCFLCSLLRRCRFSLRCRVEEAVVLGSRCGFRSAGVSLCDRILGTVQKSALGKQLCKGLLLGRRLVLGRCRVLDNLNSGLRGNRCGCITAGRSCIFPIPDLAHEVHLLLEGRTVLRHLGDLSIRLIQRK